MIEYESLRNAIIDVLDDSIVSNYDMDLILKSATYTWDNTAIKVKSKDFVMIFDEMTYELLDYEGFDMND